MLTGAQAYCIMCLSSGRDGKEQKPKPKPNKKMKTKITLKEVIAAQNGDSAKLEKINNILAESQKRATVRLVDITDLYVILREIEQIAHVSLPKSTRRAGLTVIANPNHQKFPRAYKYVPACTFVTVEWRAKMWQITKIERVTTNCGAEQKYKWYLTREEIENAKNRLFAEAFPHYIPED